MNPLTPSLWSRIDRSDLIRVALVALAAVTVAVIPLPTWARLILVIAALVGGCWPILTEAVADLRERRMSMEISMLIAIAAAAAIGEWVTSLVIVAFVLVAEILEDLSMDRSREALTDLMALLPSTARVRRGDEFVEVALEEVTVGDVLLIAPGATIPADGTVVGGTSEVDQSRITGEPLPLAVGCGDSVHAGSTNQTGALEVSVAQIGADSSYGRIITAVQQARDSDVPVQRLADQLATWLMYLAAAAAVVTWLITGDLRSTISVILVVGACGVVAGTPLAVVASIARAARHGAFIKGGAHLEALATVDTVVFDKTGTLTTGHASVVTTEVAPGWDESQVLGWAATAEARSEHLLAVAILDHARAHQVPVVLPHEFSYTPGRGVRASVEGHTVLAGNREMVSSAPDSPGPAGATPVHIDLDGTWIGTIWLADTVRVSAAPAVARIRDMGLRTVMLTGDRPESAHRIGASIGVDDVRAGLLPQEKLTAIDQLRAQRRRIVMVGDGVNDAPALARADVGIAMGSGTDIARDCADVILVSCDLADLVDTVALARRTRRIVLANFVGTILADVVGVVLAGAGMLSPLAAGIIHVGSETAFILNSARLIPGRGVQHRSAEVSAPRVPVPQ